MKTNWKKKDESRKNLVKLLYSFIIVIILLNIVFFLFIYTPEDMFRKKAIKILETKLDVPEEYDYFIYERRVGGEAPYEISVMHIEWVDEEGFNYSVDIESLHKIDKISHSITKDVDYQFTFEDYIPDNYFSYDEIYNYKYNNYIKEEPILISKIKEDIKHVSPEVGDLELVFLHIPHVVINSRIPGVQSGLVKTRVEAVAIINLNEGKYKYEYDYDGDGIIDEIKLFEDLQDSSGILVELSRRLNINYTILNTNGKVELEEGYTFGSSQGLETSMVFKDGNGEEIYVYLNKEEHGEMKIWIGVFI